MINQNDFVNEIENTDGLKNFKHFNINEHYFLKKGDYVTYRKGIVKNKYTIIDIENRFVFLKLSKCKKVFKTHYKNVVKYDDYKKGFLSFNYHLIYE